MTEPANALDHFDPAVRRGALRECKASTTLPPAGDNVNLHIHSFFSYNASGWSPSHVAWACREQGLYAAGLCDFDVLDGLEEFLDAGLELGLRTAVHLETRAFIHELADEEINSPGEPGVAYIMGGGFTRVPEPGCPERAMLQRLRDTARARNLALVERVNAALPSIAIDYVRDVAPLTPAGVATERHIVRAYINRAQKVHGTTDDVVAFWSQTLGRDAALVRGLLGTPVLDEQVRARLAKRGGVGYQQPSAATFPSADDFIRWVLACEAMPLATWLDGTSAGESDPARLIDLLVAKGVCGVNIIPDRNWNVTGPDRATKQANLRAFVDAVLARDLPIVIGTEMNRDGLPFADDLAGEALAPYRKPFRFGARVLTGHSLLHRFAGLSYVSEAAATLFPDRAERNAWFAAVGALPPFTRDVAVRLEDLGPDRALDHLRDAVRRADGPID